MLWVYGHYKYFNSFGAGTVFIRPRAERVNVHDIGLYDPAKLDKSIQIGTDVGNDMQIHIMIRPSTIINNLR